MCISVTGSLEREADLAAREMTGYTLAASQETSLSREEEKTARQRTFQEKVYITLDMGLDYVEQVLYTASQEQEEKEALYIENPSLLKKLLESIYHWQCVYNVNIFKSPLVLQTGFVLSFTLVGQVLAPICFIGASVARSANASFNIAERLSHARIDTVGMAIDIVSLAGSIMAGFSAGTLLSSGGRLFNRTKLGKFIIFTEFATDVGAGVLILAKGYDDITKVLDSSLPEDQQMGIIIQILAIWQCKVKSKIKIDFIEAMKKDNIFEELRKLRAKYKNEKGSFTQINTLLDFYLERKYGGGFTSLIKSEGIKVKPEVRDDFIEAIVEGNTFENVINLKKKYTGSKDQVSILVKLDYLFYSKSSKCRGQKLCVSVFTLCFLILLN